MIADGGWIHHAPHHAAIDAEEVPRAQALVQLLILDAMHECLLMETAERVHEHLLVLPLVGASGALAAEVSEEDRAAVGRRGAHLGSLLKQRGGRHLWEQRRRLGVVERRHGGAPVVAHELAAAEERHGGLVALLLVSLDLGREEAAEVEKVAVIIRRGAAEALAAMKQGRRRRAVLHPEEERGRVRKLMRWRRCPEGDCVGEVMIRHDDVELVAVNIDPGPGVEEMMIGIRLLRRHRILMIMKR